MLPVRHCLGDFDNPLEAGDVGGAVFFESNVFCLLLSEKDAHIRIRVWRMMASWARRGQVAGGCKPDLMTQGPMPG